MKSVLSAFLFLLTASSLFLFPGLDQIEPGVAEALAADPESGTEQPAEDAVEAAEQPPAGDDPASGEKADKTSDEAIMKNFTRHRPGACPEGPPCKTE